MTDCTECLNRIEANAEPNIPAWKIMKWHEEGHPAHRCSTVTIKVEVGNSGDFEVDANELTQAIEDLVGKIKEDGQFATKRVGISPRSAQAIVTSVYEY